MTPDWWHHRQVRHRHFAWRREELVNETFLSPEYPKYVPAPINRFLRYWRQALVLPNRCEWGLHSLQIHQRYIDWWEKFCPLGYFQRQWTCSCVGSVLTDWRVEGLKLPWVMVLYLHIFAERRGHPDLSSRTLPSSSSWTEELISWPFIIID